MLSTVSPSLSPTIAGPAVSPPGRGTEAIFVLDVPNAPVGMPVGVAASLPAPIGVPEVPGLSGTPPTSVGSGEIPALAANLPGLVAHLPGTIDRPDGVARPPIAIDVPGIDCTMPAEIDLPYVPVDRQPIAAGGVTLPDVPVDLPGKGRVAGPAAKVAEGKLPGRGPGVSVDLFPCPSTPGSGDIDDPAAELPRPIFVTPRAPFLPEKMPAPLKDKGEATSVSPPVLAAPLMPAAAVPVVPVAASPLASATPGDLTPVVASPIAPAEPEDVPPLPAPPLSQPIVSKLPAPVRPGRPTAPPTDPILTPQVRGGPEMLDPEPVDDAKPHRPTRVAADIPTILVPQDAPSPLPASAPPPLAEEKPRPEEMPAEGPGAPQPAPTPNPTPTVAPLPAPVEGAPASLPKQPEHPPLVEAATPRPVGVAAMPQSIAPSTQPTDGPTITAAPPVQGPVRSADTKPAAAPRQAERIAQPLPPMTDGGATIAPPPTATTPTAPITAPPIPANPGAPVVVARPSLPPAVKARVARLEQPAGPLPGPVPTRPTAPTVQASPIAAVAPSVVVPIAAPVSPAAAAPATPTATPPAAAAAIPVTEVPSMGQPVAERPVETPVRAAPVTAPVPAAALPPEAAIRSVTAPAREVFAAAIERARRSPAAGTAAAPAEMLAAATPVAVRPAAPMQDVPLDMTASRWTEDMVSRIERMLDRADASDGRIRLRPDALGNVDLTVRSDGGQVHVHFRAEVAETRQMLRDAAPRLADAAEARGLQLGDASVSGGSQQGQAQDQQRGRDARASAAPLPNRRSPDRTSDDPTPEQRLA